MVTRFKIDSKVLERAISATDLAADRVEEKLGKFSLVKWKTREKEPIIIQI